MGLRYSIRRWKTVCETTQFWAKIQVEKVRGDEQ